jgi:hypothetical protein
MTIIADKTLWRRYWLSRILIPSHHIPTTQNACVEKPSRSAFHGLFKLLENVNFDMSMSIPLFLPGIVSPRKQRPVAASQLPKPIRTIFRDVESVLRKGQSKQHDTHLDSYSRFWQYAAELQNGVTLRLFHKVVMLRSEQQFFEYVGCHSGTGLLGSMVGAVS